MMTTCFTLRLLDYEKNNRRGRLLNRLMNSLNEVNTLKISSTVSKHTNRWLLTTECANVVLRGCLQITFASRKLKTHYSGLGSATIIPLIFQLTAVPVISFFYKILNCYYVKLKCIKCSYLIAQDNAYQVIYFINFHCCLAINHTLIPLLLLLFLVFRITS